MSLVTHTVFINNDIQRFQAIVLAKALELYAHTGHCVNRAYKPTAMIHTAGRMCGISFRPRDYLRAANTLRETFVRD